MTRTLAAATGGVPVRQLALQSGRGVAEGLFALFVLAAVTTVLAYRGVGGQLMRLANLILVVFLVVALVFLLV
jgi:hypothetical protein